MICCSIYFLRSQTGCSHHVCLHFGQLVVHLVVCLQLPVKFLMEFQAVLPGPPCHVQDLRSFVCQVCHTSRMVPWHSLYKHSLYVTKFIRTFFIRDRVYTGQSLYGTKFIQGQSLYEDKVDTGTKFIRDKVHTVTKFIRGQSLYNSFHTVLGILELKDWWQSVRNMYTIQSNHTC